jgi:hypothetical protein
VYSFLNPAEARNGLVAAYVFGIAVAICIIFAVVRGLVAARKWVTEEKMGRLGKFYGARGMGTGEVELETVRMWEK